MKINLLPLLFLLTQLTGCMTLEMLEIAKANGDIQQYEARDFFEINNSDQPNIFGICIIHDAFPSLAKANSAIYVDVDFSKAMRAIKVDTKDLQTKNKCVQHADSKSKSISIFSPHDADNLHRHQLANRGAFRTRKVLLAHQNDDYRAPVQRYTAYRNQEGVITGSTEIVIDGTALQHPISRTREIAAYAMVPFAIVGDVVTSPIQALGVLMLINSLPAR